MPRHAAALQLIYEKQADGSYEVWKTGWEQNAYEKFTAEEFGQLVEFARRMSIDLIDDGAV